MGSAFGLAALFCGWLLFFVQLGIESFTPIWVVGVLGAAFGDYPRVIAAPLDIGRFARGEAHVEPLTFV